MPIVILMIEGFLFDQNGLEGLGVVPNVNGAGFHDPFGVAQCDQNDNHDRQANLVHVVDDLPPAHVTLT